MNIRYFGLYDGHDVKRLVKVFREIKDMTGPKLVHVRTVKGKGFAPAEADPATWHAPGKFDEETGERVKGGKEGPLKYQDVFGKTLVELAEKNDKIVGITAAMPSGTSMSLMLEAMPRRAFDVGISEGHAVTFAGGLAKDGLHPYCAIYSTFLQRGYDSIIHDVAIQGLPVTFCIDRGGIVGEDGVTHHGLFDLAYLRCIPGMTVASPINEHDLRNLMFTAQLEGMGPFAIRYPRGKGVLTDWRNEMQALSVGRGRCLRQGQGVAPEDEPALRGLDVPAFLCSASVARRGQICLCLHNIQSGQHGDTNIHPDIELLHGASHDGGSDGAGAARQHPGGNDESGSVVPE